MTVGRPFSPDPNKYKPANVTGAPAASYELALTNPDFKFPQLWRSNIGVDQRLPGNMAATVEYMYNRDVNGMYYINANLPAPQAAFTGADTRVRYTSARINSNVSNATVLKNQGIGRSWSISSTLKKTFSEGFVQAAYNYGSSRNTVDPGSIAAGSFTGNAISNDPTT